MDWNRKFLKKLEKAMEEFKEDSVFLKKRGEAPDTLRLLLAVGEEGDDLVVMDVAVYQFENGLQMLQFYTVVVTDVEEKVLPELLCRINQLNLPVPLGAFGYFEDDCQVYHKYNLMVEEPADMDLFTQSTVTIILLIHNILDSYRVELYQAAERS